MTDREKINNDKVELLNKQNELLNEYKELSKQGLLSQAFNKLNKFYEIGQEYLEKRKLENTK